MDVVNKYPSQLCMASHVQNIKDRVIAQLKDYISWLRELILPKDGVATSVIGGPSRPPAVRPIQQPRLVPLPSQ